MGSHHRIIVTKRGERVIIEINPMKIFRKLQDKTEYSSGLENIRIYRQNLTGDDN